MKFTLIERTVNKEDFQNYDRDKIGGSMLYCPTCGTKLPEEKGVKFCPNCGSSIHDALRRMETAWSCTLQTRTIVFLATLLLCFTATVFGALAEVDPLEASNIKREMDSLETAIETVGVQVIFGNNFMHTLVMFVPIVGPGWGFFVLYNTGRVFAAIAAIMKMNPIFLLSLTFLHPFAWMEYISYALAISESFILAYSIIKHGFKSELKTMSIVLTVCSVILLLAAIIEFAIIKLAL
ncbi:MAG: zinc-ribbon domain-containing protein [Candidatus Bathyarchaeota archaeon]|nr:zinc-ribbon domain-containing protein [Candidatus Bathyarchaeota archaeon]